MIDNNIKDIFDCLRKYAQLTPDAIDDLHYLEGHIDYLQTRWNSLREWLEEQHQFIIEIPVYTKEISIEHKTMEICYENILDKMNELEGVDNENN